MNVPVENVAENARTGSIAAQCPFSRSGHGRRGIRARANIALAEPSFAICRLRNATFALIVNSTRWHAWPARKTEMLALPKDVPRVANGAACHVTPFSPARVRYLSSGQESMRVCYTAHGCY